MTENPARFIKLKDVPAHPVLGYIKAIGADPYYDEEDHFQGWDWVGKPKFELFLKPYDDIPVACECGGDLFFAHGAKIFCNECHGLIEAVHLRVFLEMPDLSD